MVKKFCGCSTPLRKGTFYPEECIATPPLNSLAYMASQDASCSCTYGVCVKPLVCQVNVNEIHGLYDKW